MIRKDSWKIFKGMALFCVVLLLPLGCSQATGGNDAPTAVVQVTQTPEPTATSAPTKTAMPTNTSAPTSTATATHTPTATPSPVPSATPTAVGETFALDGYYSFVASEELNVDINAKEKRVGVSTLDNDILLFMVVDNDFPAGGVAVLLEEFLTAVEADTPNFKSSKPFSVTVDNVAGLATDISGQFFDEESDGRVMVLTPNEQFSMVIFSIARNGGWAENGLELTTTLIESIRFVSPEAESEPKEEVASPPTDFPLSIPTDPPLETWEGLPIMAGALAGEATEASYAFTIEATQAEVEAFYDAELPKLGWESLAIGEGENGSVIMIFEQDGEPLSVSIFVVDAETLYVLIVK